jgi:starch-binding outer membrane protein, SusD/RagB family
MKKYIYTVLVLVLSLIISSCTDYINNVDPLIDKVEDDRLTSEGQVDFVIKGVQQRFATTASQLATLSDLLSDQLIYTSDIPSASFPSFEEIDKGVIVLDNSNSTGIYRTLGELRFFADDLIDRAGKITFTNETKKKSALFNGNLYGGLARYYSATTFGLTQTQPGGIIDAGPFIDANTFLDNAINKYKEALNYSPDALNTRVVNSLIAKAYLAKKDYANTAVYAAKGLVKGDADFNALYNDVSNIYFWGFAGNGRVQIGVADRFNDYIKAEPKEANRIKLGTVTGTSKKVYYYQTKYDVKGSSFPVVTWKETNLLLAETALRGTGSGNALSLVNEVRANYTIPALSTIDLTSLFVERDKELFVQGDRLIDQNRGAVPWHLSAGTWQYLPIPKTERQANTNLPQ